MMSEDQGEVEWSIKDKVCIVTGANSGIGRATAIELAKRGAAKVILACRNLTSGEEAAKEIRAKAGFPDDASQRVVVKHLDLASFESVRKFANDILATEPVLNVLVNNAGIEQPNEKILTGDGFEITFQTNHLGPFLLTNLLLELLKKSKPSRIVVVASMSYSFTLPWGFNLMDVNQDNVWFYSPSRQYDQSKLANILFIRELHKRLNGDYNLEGAPSGVSVFSLHPGLVKTAILRNRQGYSFLGLLMYLNGTSIEEGAKTPLYCACEPNIEKDSGKFFDGCKPAGLWWVARDDAKACALWEFSENACKETK